MDCTEVEWRDVVGYEGRYKVSNHGDICSLITGKTLRPGKQSRGYLSVGLYDGSSPKKQRSLLVHRIVTEAFLGKAPDSIQVNHKNGNKSDCRLENLEYVTQSENMQHAFATGLNRARRGEESHNARLTNDQAAKIKQLFAEGRLGRGKGKVSKAELCRQFGVTQRAIYSVVHGESFRDVPPSQDLLATAA